MSAWKTIDSAPKDGSYVLAYEASRTFPADAEETYFLVQWYKGRWRIALDGQTASPTHYMDLPAPPLPGESNARFIAGPKETK